jgi:hypothetical protein
VRALEARTVERTLLLGGARRQWRVEVLIERESGDHRWTLTSPMESWSAARISARKWEREGFKARVVWVNERGELVR